VTDAEARVLALERRNRVARQIHEAGVLSDAGPYDADALIKSWAPDGRYDTGLQEYNGRNEIYTFYDRLAATFTIHYFTNVVVELRASSDEAVAFCYAFEAPVVGGEALFGGFEHAIRCRSSDVEEVWLEREQTVHFLAPARTGWAAGRRIAEQNKPAHVAATPKVARER